MGLLLYIVATVLWIIITPINWVIVAFKFGLSNKYFQETAVDIDRFANRNFRTFLNATMIRTVNEFWAINRMMRVEPHYFGDERETISSVLGKNEIRGTLSTTGKLLCWILNKLDKDHCQKSIIVLEDKKSSSI